MCFIYPLPWFDFPAAVSSATGSITTETTRETPDTQVARVSPKLTLFSMTKHLFGIKDNGVSIPTIQDATNCPIRCTSDD
jgi:hypothetical protein